MNKTNSIIFLGGCLIISISLIISSILFSNNIKNQNYVISGYLGGLSQTVQTEKNDNNIIPIGEAARIFGYEDIKSFEKVVLSGGIADIPYIYCNERLIFVRETLEKWLVNSSKEHTRIP